jgi:hypothetical protein
MMRRCVLIAVVFCLTAAPALAARGPVTAAAIRPTAVYVGAPLPVLRFHTVRRATLTLSLVRCTTKQCSSSVNVALVKATYAVGTHTLGIRTLLRRSSLKPRLTKLAPAIYAVVFKQGRTVLGSTDFGVNGKT